MWFSNFKKQQIIEKMKETRGEKNNRKITANSKFQTSEFPTCKKDIF